MAEQNMSKQKPPRTPPTARAAAKAAKPTPRAAHSPSARPVASTTLPRADQPAPLEAAVQRLEASVAELKRERDDLAARLSSAQAEITTLNSARKAAIDRIDWVIDSLHTALQDKS